VPGFKSVYMNKKKNIQKKKLAFWAIPISAAFLIFVLGFAYQAIAQQIGMTVGLVGGGSSDLVMNASTQNIFYGLASTTSVSDAGFLLVQKGIDNSTFRVNISGDIKSAGKMELAGKMGLNGAAINSSYALNATGSINTTGGYCIGGTSCVTDWADVSSAALPAGSAGATLRHNGTTWLSNTNLYNDGTNVGIGTVSPNSKLDVAGALKIANTIDTCDSTQTGTFKYDPTSGQSYLCDGTRWLNQKNCGLMTEDSNPSTPNVPGKSYGTVQIGGQCWMAENINIGTMLATGGTPPNTGDQIIEKWCYNNDPNNCESDGGLYNWNEAMRGSEVAGARGICAAGWHIPTDAEYNQLEKTVLGVIASPNTQYACNMSYSGWRRCADDNAADSGGPSGAGKSLKSVGVGLGVGAGNDLVGFAGKLPGYRSTNGSFNNLGSNLYLWSSTPSGTTIAWSRYLYTSYSTVHRNAINRSYGFSVRCLKNSEENQTVNLNSYGGTYVNNFTINKDDASPNFSGSTLFTVLQTGNVGIGTTGPSNKLHVSDGTVQSINAGGGHIGGLELTPVNNDQAASKYYVDDTVSGYSVPTGDGDFGYWSLGAGTIYNRDLASGVGINTTNSDGITFAVAQGSAGFGTVSSASTTDYSYITGLNTRFLDSFRVGDYFKPNSRATSTITAIYDNEAMQVDTYYNQASPTSTFSNYGYNIIGVPDGGVLRFVVKGSGQVGIGTIDPQASLHISSDGTNELSDKAIIVGDASSSVAFSVSRTGKVAIGTSTAEEMLSIGEGKIYLGDVASTTGNVNRLYSVDGELHWNDELVGGDTNAETICSAGYYLNGDGTCDAINTNSGWNLYNNGTSEETISEYETLDFNSGTGVNVIYDGVDDLNFSFDCSDVDGTGLSCSGETLNVTETGDISAVTAGTGLTGGGTSGSVTLNADTGYMQRRVSSSCAAGSSIRIINSDGTVTCEADTDTDTNTNAATLCGSGYFLNGDGSCDVVPVDTDTDTNTNASTMCIAGSFLNGDGSCDIVPVDTDTYNNGWDLSDNGTIEERITEFHAVDFNNGTGVNVSFDGVDDLIFTFDCSDVAGTGLSCSGETLNADGGSGLWTDGGTDIYYASDVGVGTTAPNSRLHVNGASGANALRVQVAGASKLIVASNGGVTIGAFNDSPPANGLYVGGSVGIGTDSPGSYKLSVIGGTYGIYGKGSSHGVYGVDSGSGSFGKLGSGTVGAYGKNISTGSWGTLGDGNYGVRGEGGIYGVRGSGSTWGVYGEDSGTGSYGKLGNGTYGVYGSGTYGVYGYASDTGVYGKDSGSGSWGKLGNGEIGVYGSGTGYGVYGISSSVGVYGSGPTYNFYAGGSGTDYGPFTGGHEIKLSKDCPEDIKPGMLVSVTGETQFREGENEIAPLSSTLPTVSLSSSENDKKVFGVFTKVSPLLEDHWYYDEVESEDRFATANALGEGRALVTNYNGEIEAGDYITTSNIVGYGMKQGDDLLHSYTLGKAIEDVNWSEVEDTIEYNGEEYKFYLISVVYTSG
jgi:uncharacterized protein (TIGR02145 family)